MCKKSRHRKITRSQLNVNISQRHKGSNLMKCSLGHTRDATNEILGADFLHREVLGNTSDISTHCSSHSQHASTQVVTILSTPWRAACSTGTLLGANYSVCRESEQQQKRTLNCNVEKSLNSSRNHSSNGHTLHTLTSEKRQITLQSLFSSKMLTSEFQASSKIKHNGYIW